MLEKQLDAALKAVAPVDGVSFGKRDDKKTWTIQFKPDATPEQVLAAQAVLDSFVYQKPADMELTKQAEWDAINSIAKLKDWLKKYTGI